jgi:hypothetical protein
MKPNSCWLYLSGRRQSAEDSGWREGDGPAITFAYSRYPGISCIHLVWCDLFMFTWLYLHNFFGLSA